MELTFLRGACVIVETKGKRILMDPWLFDGCYYGAWAHFPPFTRDDWEKHEFQNIDYIYVSHIHPDHFDPPTMRFLRNYGCQAPVLIHKYPTVFLKKHIQELGFETIELTHGSPFDMGRGVSLRVFSADDCDPAACGAFYGCAMPGVRNTQIDSLAVLTDGLRTLVNINDCPWLLSKGLATKIGNDYTVDLALIAYAGAGPYPQCFGFPKKKMRDEAKLKRSDFLGGVINFAKSLNAKQVFPFAGDYQLCGSLADLNEYRGVPELNDVYSALAMADIPALELPIGMTSTVGEPCPYHISDLYRPRREYVEDYLSYRKLDYEHEAAPTAAEIETLLPAAFERFDAKRKEYGMQCRSTAYITLPTHPSGYAAGMTFLSEYEIPPEGPARIVPHKQLAGPQVSISTDARLLKRLLQGPKEGQAHWNNAQIGSHIQFRRDPNVYEPGLYHLLSFFHA